MAAAVTLLVLRVSDIESSKRFYEALGLIFTAEQHDNGPLHWSAVVGETVVELYPAGSKGPTLLRLGLRVNNVSSAVAAVLALGGRAPQASADPSPRVVIDPDGNAVELTTFPERESEAEGLRWCVCRQDDNGNRFVISGGHSRRDAERLCAEFEARGHKQMYWASPEDEHAR